MKKPRQGPSLCAVLNAIKPDFLLCYAEPAVQEWVKKANNNLWNWEDSAYRAGLTGLTTEQYWAFVKFYRAQPAYGTKHLTDSADQPFSFRLPAPLLESLHIIDTNLGGSVQAVWPTIKSDAEQNRYLISALCEEAIASSEIEGAVVTRKEAKEMLLQNRKPKNRDQQMVLNNFRTIQMLNERKSEPLTVELLEEIQRQLTENAIDDVGDSGRLRRPDEPIKVWDEEDQQTLHVSPAAENFPERLRRLCQFANDDGTKLG